MSEIEGGYIQSKIPVPSRFEDVFTHFYFAGNQTADIITRTLIPSFQTMLIFCFGDHARLRTGNAETIEVDKCILIGPVKRAFDYSIPSNASILVANFKEDAFHRFFANARMPEHLPKHPDELLYSDCFTDLWQELDRIDDLQNRVNRILAFSEPYLQNRDKIAAQLTDFADTGLDRIKVVSGQNRQTTRNTQLHQKKYFGYSAKEHQRYQRFISAIAMIQRLIPSHSTIDWFDIISECGYYDQSQLIHDFQHFIQLTPARYLRFQEDVCRSMP